MSNGYDIRFTNSDGTTLLPYERESWSGGDGNPVVADFWVKVPRIYYLPTGDQNKIYIYYGKSDATDGQDVVNVWSNNYVSVYHMATGISTENDSTSNDYDLTETGTVDQTISGKIYKARQNSSSGNNYLYKTDATDLDGLQKMTFQGWIRDTQNDTSPRAIISKRTSASSNLSYSIFLYQNRKLYFDNGNSIGTGADARINSDTDIMANTWTMFHCVFDGSLDPASRKKIYINGALDKTGTAAMTTIPNTSSSLRVGIMNDQYSSSWVGQLDEVRISKDARSAAWNKFEYYNMNSDDNEMSWVGQESVSDYPNPGNCQSASGSTICVTISTIANSNTMTSFVVDPASIVAGQPVTLTANLSGVNGQTVTFTDDTDSITIGDATITSGVATISYTPLLSSALDYRTIKANYAGDSTHDPSYKTYVLQIEIP
jgi:hypothetical protein